MSTIADAAVVAALIMDIISMYRKQGVEVDLDSLEEAIANERARMDRTAKLLGL